MTNSISEKEFTDFFKLTHAQKISAIRFIESYCRWIRDEVVAYKISLEEPFLENLKTITENDEPQWYDDVRTESIDCNYVYLQCHWKGACEKDFGDPFDWETVNDILKHMLEEHEIPFETIFREITK